MPSPASSRAARSRIRRSRAPCITVPEVRMTPDLKLANAYVMPLGGERADEIVEALNRHRKFIRGRIAPELDLKFAPEVKFFVDNTFDEFGRIDALLRSDRVQRDLRQGRRRRRTRTEWPARRGSSATFPAGSSSTSPTT